MTNQRPSKIEYYLNIAKAVSKRSTCLRRKFGAVIVSDDYESIMTTGYNGAPRKTDNCIDLGYCARDKAGIPHGQRYELCRASATHAEQNAIINAAREGIKIKNCIMFLYGENPDGTIVENAEPCRMCKSQIINAGITKVYVKRINDYEEYDVEDWIKNYPKEFTPENTEGY
ncbi:MAG: dCMP deaminase family protein [Candidatus Aenigmarchaeota archaeon]|nr:dCMP deaminase family protein [Candidatus Aenigmarchaeota archaeon]